MASALSCSRAEAISSEIVSRAFEPGREIEVRPLPVVAEGGEILNAEGTEAVFMGARGVLLSWRARGDRWLVTGAAAVR